MIFLFKKKPIHLDCFTSVGVVADLTPITKSSEFLPEWWKKIKNVQLSNERGVMFDVATMRGCTGFIDLFKHGVIIPSWTELNIKIGDDGVNWVHPIKSGTVLNAPVTSHPSYQYGDHFEDHIHLKITSPWCFYEKTGVNFYWSGFTWGLLDKFPNFTFLNGVIEFKHQHNTNINIFARKERFPYQYNIKTEIPLIQIVPISDKPVKPHIHCVDDREFERLRRKVAHTRFTKSYIHRLKSKNK